MAPFLSPHKSATNKAYNNIHGDIFFLFSDLPYFCNSKEIKGPVAQLDRATAF
mgnify:CR=1 FL=1|jgi:hypothetical protein